MKKLIEQLVKFGVVGVIAAVIDFGLLNVLVAAFHVNNVVASTISFLVSLAFNYWASMKYVFKRRADMARWMEGFIFLSAAVVGLFINDLIIWMSTLGMAANAAVVQHGMYVLRTNIGKIVATVVVAIWNFIIRKWLLDDHSDHSDQAGKDGKAAESATSGTSGTARRTFAQKLGEWSIEHTPKGWQ
ncbi:GtrA family protein [Bifidobacterium sp. ESL0763]|uniref:GtrA family protein n=1 Tax=Bifidobacterium sp. ESL0763 TaxID=2983227 RepID=UPI0023FA483E|nr:GtrA family protein [Bifidobacterium sp. ESL0763]MDF7664397.1 GtrA family protein [Bifidobacterium sp. ESL0763]